LSLKIEDESFNLGRQVNAKKIRIKTMVITYKVTEMKNCLRTVVCASKVNISSLIEKVKKADDGI
jgi:hypothetical protein